MTPSPSVPSLRAQSLIVEGKGRWRLDADETDARGRMAAVAVAQEPGIARLEGFLVPLARGPRDSLDRLVDGAHELDGNVRVQHGGPVERIPDLLRLVGEKLSILRSPGKPKLDVPDLDEAHQVAESRLLEIARLGRDWAKGTSSARDGAASARRANMAAEHRIHASRLM